MWAHPVLSHKHLLLPLSPPTTFNTHSICLCSLNLANSFRSKDFCPCYSWYLECDFLPPNHLELNLNIPSSKRSPLAIQAKAYSSSTLLSHALSSFIVFMPMWNYLVLYVFLFTYKSISSTRAETFCIPSIQDLENSTTK